MSSRSARRESFRLQLVSCSAAWRASRPRGRRTPIPTRRRRAPLKFRQAVAPPAVEQSSMAPYKPFVLMPFVRLQSIQNDNSGTGPGLRIGDWWELASTNNSPSTASCCSTWRTSTTFRRTSAKRYFVQFAAAPLFHIQASPAAEIVLGPKLGLFVEHASCVALRSGGERQRRGSPGRSECGRVLPTLRRPRSGRPDQLRLHENGVVQQRPGELHGEDNGIKVISFTGAAQF